MNPRERIKLAVNHKEPDRVPIDLGGTRVTGIASIPYVELRKNININTNLSKMYDFIQQLIYPEEKFREIFHIDTIDAGQAFLLSEGDWKKWTLDNGETVLIPKFLNLDIDSDKTVYMKDDDGLILGNKPISSNYVGQSFWVYKDLPALPKEFIDNDMNKLLWGRAQPWHLNIFNDEHYEMFINLIKKLYEETDYAIILGVGCATLEYGTFLRGFDNFMCDIYLDKNGVLRFLEKVLEKNFKKLERVLKGVGKYIDILTFSDDLGAQDRLFISIEKYRKLFKPVHKKMWDFVHQSSDCKIFLHSCGAIYEVIPDLIDAGLDILNPVQTSAKGMNAEKLKKEFGKDLTFWGGGIDTDILTFGTPKEVKEDVKKRIKVFSENGGYVFNQVHNIQANVPPQNIIAMFETVYNYGSY